MRNEIVAGIGGLVIGHILWLLAMSIATDSGRVNQWCWWSPPCRCWAASRSGVLGWRKYKDKSYAWAALLWFLPVSPVLFSLAVLGVTYL